MTHDDAPESRVGKAGPEGAGARLPPAPMRRRSVAQRLTKQLDASLTRLVHRLVVMVSAVVLVGYALMMLAHHHWQFALPLLAQLGITLWSARIATRSRRYGLALEITLWPAFLMLSLLTIAQGGEHGTAVWWLMTVPIAMLIGGGVISGVVMLVLMIAQLVVTHALVETGQLTVLIDRPLGSMQAMLAITGSLGCVGLLLAMAVRWRRDVLQQLDRSLTDAEEAMQVKARFIANMSHEIRTPLNGIVGAGEMMRLSSLDAGQRQAVQILDHSTRSLLSVVNDVLDFSKLEAGQVQLEKVEIDPRALAHDAVEMFASQADSRGIELWAHSEPDVPEHITTDPVRLRQVLHNLLANAVKFTEQGEVRLRLSVHRDARATWLRLSVNDTGIGLSDAQQARLFQAFAQADISTTRRYGGTGLGLAISRELATLLGGHIDVTSHVGHGSTFTVNLPLPTLAPTGPTFADTAQGGTAAISAGAAAVPRIGLYCHSPALQDDLCQWFGAIGDPCVALHLDSVDALVSARQAGMQLIVADDRALRAAGLARSTWASRVEHVGLGCVLLLGVSVPADAVPGHLVPVYKPVRPQRLGTALRDAHRILLELRATREQGQGVQATEAFALDEDRRQRVQHAAAAHPAAAAIQAARGAPPCVLVVEDNAVNRVIAQALLEQLGIRADTAEDGLDALARLHTPGQDFAAVLMDCHMPELDGLEATRRWRQAEQLQGRPHLPIIAMTANSPAEAAPACAEAGMDDFIAKPFALGDLHTVLARWLTVPVPARPKVETTQTPLA